ncbi:SDR family NAD(P)-dependent oxidoreductase [Arthrobacter sp. R1-13]
MSSKQKDRVALVTGGNRGLGLEIARQLAGHGHHVILGSRNKPSGESAAAEVRGEGVLVNAASPGYTRTDMSPKATRSVEDGADTPVWLATLPEDGPSGGYFYERSPLPW